MGSECHTETREQCPQTGGNPDSSSRAVTVGSTSEQLGFPGLCTFGLWTVITDKIQETAHRKYMDNLFNLKILF